jgi:arylsulfatase A-like enzyme
MGRVRAQYFGMIAEVDAQLGRLFAAIAALGAWEETFVVVTSDHGEQLGDHGLTGKGGFFEESYAIPCIMRDPRPGRVRGGVVQAFTEAVDVLPTLAEAMGLPVPDQCDGFPLTPFLNGEAAPAWRDAAHWEFDWRAGLIDGAPQGWPWDRRLEARNLAVRRGEEGAYVQFADGSWLAFDLKADASWRTPLTDAGAVLVAAQAMLAWRAQHTDRTLTGALIDHGVKGRSPVTAWS